MIYHLQMLFDKMSGGCNDWGGEGCGEGTERKEKGKRLKLPEKI